MNTGHFSTLLGEVVIVGCESVSPRGSSRASTAAARVAAVCRFVSLTEMNELLFYCELFSSFITTFY